MTYQRASALTINRPTTSKRTNDWERPTERTHERSNGRTTERPNERTNECQANCFMHGRSLSVFTEAMFFVLLRQEATFLPFGRTQVPRRITPGKVTLLNKDPIRTLLYRHVIIMIRDGTAMIGTRVNATILVVTKATNPARGRAQCLLTGDLARVSPGSLRIIIRTRHVTHDNSRTIGSMAG